MKLLRSMPLLQVADVTAARRFYEQAGFVVNATWVADETGVVSFGIMQRGQVTLGLVRGAARVNDLWAAYLYVDDIDALHGEFVAAGLQPSEIRRNVDYACDDFDLCDPDGHRIAFGMDRSNTWGPGLGPAQGRG